MRIAVIDGMGGGLAAQVVSQLTGKLPEQVELIGLGTNALATAAMLKAGVKRGDRRKCDLYFSGSSRFDRRPYRHHHTQCYDG